MVTREETQANLWTKRFVAFLASALGIFALLGAATKTTTLPNKWASTESYVGNFRHASRRYLKTAEPRVMYTHAATDRSGHAIISMVKAQAYCFANGWVYGGDCGDTKREDLNEDVIQGLGIGNVVKYACPSDPDNEKNFLRLSAYSHDELEDFTPEWFNYMKLAAPRLVELATRYDDDDIFRVAVHVRRGDVSLCTGNAWKRYLPNSHFTRLIDRVLEGVTQPYQVTIYSEAEYGREKYVQYESFQVFKDKNYTVFLGGDIVEVMEEFISADVLITGKSAFSLLPAFLRLDRGGVVYTPFIQDAPLPHWEVVDDKFMTITNQEMYEMERMVCPEHGAETDRDRFIDFED